MGATAGICGEVSDTNSGEVWHRQPYYWTTIGDGDWGRVIMYGDWGRRPNLKHQAPSPGIGLRRILHATPGIVTITVREAYTLSFCPRCAGHVDNDRGSHGLMLCDNCGVRWSRDVLGAKNIVSQGHAPADDAGRPPDIRGLKPCWVVEQTSTRPMRWLTFSW